MSLWSSFKEKAKVIGNQLSENAQWVLDNATIAKVSTALFKLTANTLFHILEQGLALRKAVPTSLYNRQARKVLAGMSYVVAHDVMPVVAINALNNQVQNYFREDYDKENSSVGYSLFIHLLTLGNYFVMAYTWRRGTETCLRVAVLDIFAPIAFNSNKKKTIDPSCVNCNMVKGMGRELGVLLANDGLIYGVNYIPYIGTSAARLLTIINNGRYITRSVTPERCDRHKFMEQEFVLALGVIFELNCWLMNKGLTPITGPLPFLYWRTLQHLMLALYVNLAAHMTVPSVQARDATIPVDLFNYYERVWSFLLDVFWAGLLKRVPIDFKLGKGEPHFVPLSKALQLGVRLFNSDLERETRCAPHFIANAFKKLLPPMLRSAYDFTKDPVIAPYWPKIREGAIAVFEKTEHYENNNVVASLAWAPKTSALILELKFGIPHKLTRVILRLTKEQDFWELTHAIKAWFERHNLKEEVSLVGQSTSSWPPLCGDKPVEISTGDHNKVALPLAQLTEKKQNESLIAARRLMPYDAKDVSPQSTPAKVSTNVSARQLMPQMSRDKYSARFLKPQPLVKTESTPQQATLPQDPPSDPSFVLV